MSDYFVISGSRDTTIRITDKHNGKTVEVLEGMHNNDIKCLHFLPSGRGHDLVSGALEYVFHIIVFGNNAVRIKLLQGVVGGGEQVESGIFLVM